MIEVKHLQLITAIEQMGSLSAAAKALHLSQSALSHQLRQLEEEVGMPLFRRINNQLHFTAAGKTFREKAAAILDEFGALEQQMEDLRVAQLNTYIHGYSNAEAQRLQDQAQTVTDFIHWDSHWPAGESVLEAGCGVGAQTKIIAALNPDTRFTAIDISPQSLQIAEQAIQKLGINNVKFATENVEQLSYRSNSFDHIFICFLLEHLPRPLKALQELRRVLKPGGTITVVEGDHGSTFFHPDSPAARKVVHAQVQLQQKNGGNANIGRQLYPLLHESGFQDIQVSPRQIYVDDSKPPLVDGFIRNTFTAMIQGISEDAVANQIVTSIEMQAGVDALLQTAAGGGTFSYTFFKATARK